MRSLASTHTWSRHATCAFREAARLGPDRPSCVAGPGPALHKPCHQHMPLPPRPALERLPQGIPGALTLACPTSLGKMWVCLGGRVP